MINNARNEKGITLIALVITIIVTIIIASIATSVGLSTVKRTRYYEAVAEMKTMQYEVNSLYEEYKNGNEEVLNYGEDIEVGRTAKNKSVQTLSQKAFESLSITSEERVGYRYYNASYIENTLNVSGITYDFLVDVAKRNVILLEGIEYENVTYYALSQIEGAQYNVEYEDNSEVWDPTQIEYKDNVSKPKVSGKEMIPVVWDEGTLSWVKADVNWNEEEKMWEQNDSDLKWYDYSVENKKWANIVTVEENGKYSREYYIQAKSGTEILMSDITAMYVWIPRYEYKNTYYTNGTYVQESTGETIYVKSDVRFIGIDDDLKEGYTVSSAFSYVDGSNNTVNLEGFWIGKFESSNYTSKTPSTNIGTNYGGNLSSTNVTIKPNVTSWRKISVSDATNYCTQISAESNVHGINSQSAEPGRTAETGLITNDMWNAVSNLAQSKFGNMQNESQDGIYSNSYYQGDGTQDICYYTTQTGIAGDLANDYTSISGGITSLVKTKKEENTGLITINSTYKYYEYWTKVGQNASTTANIYGAFDMVGGAAEYTSGSSGKYYVRGGSFSDEGINIFSSAELSTEDATSGKEFYAFRVGLVVK